MIRCSPQIKYYFKVRMKETACQICSSVRIPFHATMEVPGFPSLIRQNRKSSPAAVCSSAKFLGRGSRDCPAGPSPCPCGPWHVAQFVLNTFAPSSAASAPKGLVKPAYSAGTGARVAFSSTADDEFSFPLQAVSTSMPTSIKKRIFFSITLHLFLLFYHTRITATV